MYKRQEVFSADCDLLRLFWVSNESVFVLMTCPMMKLLTAKKLMNSASGPKRCVDSVWRGVRHRYSGYRQAGGKHLGLWSKFLSCFASWSHVHYFLVGGNELVAYLHAHLETDTGFLQIYHHVVQRNAGFAQFEVLRLLVSLVL